MTRERRTTQHQNIYKTSNTHTQMYFFSVWFLNRIVILHLRASSDSGFVFFFTNRQTKMRNKRVQLTWIRVYISASHSYGWRWLLLKTINKIRSRMSRNFYHKNENAFDTWRRPTRYAWSLVNSRKNTAPIDLLISKSNEKPINRRFNHLIKWNWI